MSPDDQKRLARLQLGFVEAITASLSHEINNVFAIINELSGLLQDIMSASEQGRPFDPKKIKRLTKKIGQNIDRGTGQTKQLNRFGHSLNPSPKELDAGKILNRVDRLCQRFATQKRAQLEISVPADPVPVNASLFDLQHVMFRCILTGLAGTGRGGTIRVELQKQNDGILVRLTADETNAESKDLSSELGSLSFLAERFGGKVKSSTEPGQPFEVTVSLPPGLNPISPV